MWSILKIYMGLVLLTIYVDGNDEDGNYNDETRMYNAWSRNALIDGIFWPLFGVPFYSDEFAKIFEGANVFDEIFVALKISSKSKEAKREYEMYSYLNAIKMDKEPDVEKYGISSIYYYNQCGSSAFTVFTFFECNLWAKKSEPNVQFVSRDYLILFRNFVRQSKYVHSCGVMHGNVNPMNIMLKEGRSFLTDFSLSSKMKIFPLDDWRDFLLTMALLVNNETTGIEKFDKQRIHWEREKEKKFCINELKLGISHKKYIEQTMQSVKCNDLGAVMVEFYIQAFKQRHSFPNCNHLDEIITEKIQDSEKNPAVFSWLEDDAYEIAFKDLQEKVSATAKEIKEPGFILDKNYAKPEYEYFAKKKEEMANKAGKNLKNFEEEVLKKKKELLEKKKKKDEIRKMFPSVEKKEKVNWITRGCFGGHR